MRLIELNPAWLFASDGVTRIGFAFDCPLSTRKQYRQTCFFQPTPSAEQRRAVAVAIGATGDDYEQTVAVHKVHQLCKEECGWQLHQPPAPVAPPALIAPAAADFATLTCMPSLDGSAGGNWHGHITNGDIVGGIP